MILDVPKIPTAQEYALLSKEDKKKAQELYACELHACENDLLYFLGYYVKIQVTPKPGEINQGVIPFALYPHIVQFSQSLLTEKSIVAWKARQVYISTLLAAYCVWYTRFHKHANILLFSSGQNESKELLAKTRRIWAELPEWMRFKLDPDSTEELGFPANGSAIRAFPSTASAGISYTASVIIWDEHAKHPYAAENYFSSKPTRDAGGQCISVSTSPNDPTPTFAQGIYEDAKKGTNGFKWFFFGWNIIPGRDQKWYDRTKSEIPKMEVASVSPELYMLRNYPATEEEAFAVTGTTIVFNRETLKAMRADVRQPLLQAFKDIDSSYINIYKDFQVGRNYVGASDVGLGVSGDRSVTVIMDAVSGDVVADIMTDKLPPEEFAYHTCQLLKHYRNPIWWPEHNLYGRTVIRKAIEIGYRHIGYRGDKPPDSWTYITDIDLKRLGFFTGEVSRHDVIGNLIPAINSYQIRIYNLDGLDDFQHLYYKTRPLQKPKVEAAPGSHDDYVIAVGIAWLKRNTAQPDTWNAKPVQTLHFNR